MPATAQGCSSVSLPPPNLVQSNALSRRLSSHTFALPTDRRAAIVERSGSPTATPDTPTIHRHFRRTASATGAVGDSQHIGTRRAFRPMRRALHSGHFKQDTEAAPKPRRRASPDAHSASSLPHFPSTPPRSFLCPSLDTPLAALHERCPPFLRTRKADQTLNRKCRMSPSRTMYSLPSARSLPA
jgi:hypothetical protein